MTDTLVIAEMIQVAAASGNTALLSNRMLDSVTTKTEQQRDSILYSAVTQFQAGAGVEQVAQYLDNTL